MYLALLHTPCGSYLSYLGSYLSYRGGYLSYFGSYLSYLGNYHNYHGSYLSYRGGYLRRFRSLLLLLFLVVLTTCRVPLNPLVRRVMIH